MIFRQKNKKVENKTLEERLESAGLNTFKIPNIHIQDEITFEIIRYYDANGSGLEAYMLIASSMVNEHYSRMWISYSQWTRTFAKKELTPKYIKQARFRIPKKEFDNIVAEFNKQFLRSIAMNGVGFDKAYSFVTDRIYHAILNSNPIQYH